MAEEFLTLAQVGRLVNLTRQQCLNLVNAGQLKASLIAGRYLCLPEHVQEFQRRREAERENASD